MSKENKLDTINYTYNDIYEIKSADFALIIQKWINFLDDEFTKIFEFNMNTTNKLQALDI